MSKIGQHQKALDYSRQCLNIAQQIGNRGGEGQAINLLGITYKYMNNYESATECFQRAYQIAYELEDLGNQGSILFNLGGIYILTEQTEEGWLLWLKSMLIYDKLQLNNQVQLILKHFFVELCKHFGEKFFDNKITKKVYKKIFSSQLNAISAELGHDAAQRVIELLITI